MILFFPYDCKKSAGHAPEFIYDGLVSKNSAEDPFRPRIWARSAGGGDSPDIFAESGTKSSECGAKQQANEANHM